ncbi:hypothetical protein C7437_102423 [Psychrobacillus insolitus]|uniref:Uncharacterized protein n=1 Tax=Psychrobacillus insolitus TaxID=1461 RepID=A0A2W7MHN4_9BACI|nr:hypothetical protein [Psychrobacillus insolitus]PZX05956.1 hypothetical protein C7437_102423 [Psychrobacillus insolitus]
MTGILNGIVIVMNLIHDLIITIISGLGLPVNDKMIHFYFIGFLGLALYIFVDFTFKKLAKYGISLLSFIYTFSTIIVISLVIEIQQKITGEGNMEFSDITYGMWGFFLFLAVFIVFSLLFKFIFKKVKGGKK